MDDTCDLPGDRDSLAQPFDEPVSIVVDELEKLAGSRHWDRSG